MKMNESDLDLLGQYAQRGAEDAFTELVSRHLNLVYSTALRHIRSTQLAEEVAQSVFSDLARQAHQMKPGTCLPAWLYRVTRRTAIDVVRRESSRQHREQIALEIAETNAIGAGWDAVESVLDDAIEALGEADRNVLLLRYFENKNLREVGSLLGVSEDAAQKRVTRAVERLRESLGRRKIAVSGTALVTLLSVNLASAAPAGLGTAITASAVSAWAGIPQAAALETVKALVMTTTTKYLIAASMTAIVGSGFYEAHRASQLAKENQMLRQQQARLTPNAEQRDLERDQIERKLKAAQDQIAKLTRDNADLLRLRAEVSRLRETFRTGKDGDVENTPFIKSLSARLAQIKQRLEQSPDQHIPELRFMEEKDWLEVAKDADTGTEEGFHKALSHLRSVAKTKVSQDMGRALGKYTRANGGELPTDLGQLKSYLEMPLDDAVLQRYRLTQSGNVGNLKQGASVLEEISVVDEIDNRFLAGPDGYGYIGPTETTADGKAVGKGFFNYSPPPTYTTATTTTNGPASSPSTGATDGGGGGGMGNE